MNLADKELKELRMKERRAETEIAARQQTTLKLIKTNTEKDSTQKKRAANTASIFASMPDDDDTKDEEAAYDAWRARERHRVRKSKRATRQDADNVLSEAPKQPPKRQRTKMSQYYQKGPFYMDEDSIQRDEVAAGGKPDVRRRRVDELDEASLPLSIQMQLFEKRRKGKTYRGK